MINRDTDVFISPSPSFYLCLYFYQGRKQERVHLLIYSSKAHIVRVSFNPKQKDRYLALVSHMDGRNPGTGVTPAAPRRCTCRALQSGAGAGAPDGTQVSQQLG